MLKRGEVIDKLCEKVGIPRRVRPGHPYVTKRELMHINGWISAVATETKAGQIEHTEEARST